MSFFRYLTCVSCIFLRLFQGFLDVHFLDEKCHLDSFFKISPTNKPNPPSFSVAFSPPCPCHVRFRETSPHPNDGKADADGIRKDLIPEDLSLVAKVEDYPPGNDHISPKNGILKMIFLFPRRDMLVPWRVSQTGGSTNT